MSGIAQPLSDARSFGHDAICKILEDHGGTDPVILLSSVASERKSLLPI